MDSNWAEKNLEAIRTLMERSAVYRRALAPIMSFTGVVGLLGAFAGWLPNRVEIGSAFVRETNIEWGDQPGQERRMDVGRRRVDVALVGRKR